MSDDSVISCPPCHSPARCVGGMCAFQEDKRKAALDAYGLGIVPIRWITKEELVQLYPLPSQGSNEEKA